MTKASALALVVLFSALVGCQKDSTDMSYNLTENQCATGEHHFSSKDDYCNGLKNDSMNNYCAASLREETFKSNDCGGSFN